MKYLLIRILFAYVIITLLLAGLIYSFSKKNLEDKYISFFIDNAKQTVKNIEPDLNKLLISGTKNELEKLLNSTKINSGFSFTIINIDSNIIFSNDNFSNDLNDKISKKEISFPLDDSIIHFILFNKIEKTNELIILKNVNSNSYKSGTLIISKHLDKINEIFFEFGVEIRNITLVVLFLTSILIVAYIWYLSKPIKELISSSRRVAEGLFDTKVFLAKRHELKELADNYNNMLSQLKVYFYQINSQKKELEFILNSIQDILIVLDFTGKISIASKSIEKLFKTDEIGSRYIWEFLRSEEFSDFFEQVKKSKTNISKELKIDDVYYLCSANLLFTRSEIVIIMQDITQIKKFEMIKKDFVSNVSHELRTPLTSIKGFIETMLDEANDDDKYYLEIVSRNTDRLINIVKDLLLLSNLEDNSAKLELINIDFLKIKNSLLFTFEQKLKNKNLKLNFNIYESLPDFYGDEFKLEQVFINLIDNAIKYTDQGEITVNISTRDSKILIEIEDTGAGIPTEHHERLFERFYTVDKSRSRKLGGTGLGLSIVKHIVSLHGGEIKIENDRRIGTKFEIYLPIQ
jgi:two-component system phosphate regulon sensor histidine kinase PhoR